MQSKETIIYFDNNWIKTSELGEDFFNHSLHFGSGVTEELRSYASSSSTHIFNLPKHHTSLMNLAKAVNVNFNISLKKLTQISYELLDRNELGDAKIQVVAYEKETEMKLMISAFETTPFVVQDAVEVNSSNHKNVGNESTETIQVDMDGFVMEAAETNFFFVRDEVLYTPVVSKTKKRRAIRDSIIECAMSLGYPVIERPITPEEITGSEVAFFSNSTNGVSILSKFNDWVFTSDWRNTMAVDLLLLFRQWTTNQEASKNTII